MSYESMTSDRYVEVRATAKRAIYIIVLGALLFFGALVALGDFRLFISGPGDGALTGDVLRQYRLSVLADHQNQVLLGYALTGAGQILLGIGAGLLALGVARVETAWKATLARIAAPMVLLGGVVTFVGYVWPGYWDDDVALAGIGESSGSTTAFLFGWALLALGLIGLGVVLMSGHPWPRWTGVVLVLFSALVFITLLPLFFQLGATIAAIGIAIGLRPRDNDSPD